MRALRHPAVRKQVSATCGAGKERGAARWGSFSGKGEGQGKRAEGAERSEAEGGGKRTGPVWRYREEARRLAGIGATLAASRPLSRGTPASVL